MSLTNFRISRRNFLKRTSSAIALTALPSWWVQESFAQTNRVVGGADKPKIALIGCGGQGRGITKSAQRFGQVVAVCDVDSKRAAEAAAQFGGAEVYKDFRKLLDRDDIVAVLNGTPDHWHTLINLRAMRMGKDVYSEKPLTLTIDEGKRLVAGVAKTKRILQTGSQQRSDSRFRLACELVRNGRIGKLKNIITALPAGPRGGPFVTAPVPSELDWDFWLGQTAKIDYVPERCHRNFRYFYDYSGGTLTDWGAHHNDIALWALDEKGPISVEGRELVEPIRGGYTAASEYDVRYEYANGVTQTCRSVSWNGPDGSVRGTPTPGDKGHGVTFEGSDGWLFVTRGKIEASKEEILKEPLPENREKLYVSTDHMGNFFECMQTRKQPICTAEVGHRAVSLCHLAVIAVRTGRKLKWDPNEEKFVGDKGANKFLKREMRNKWDYSVA